MPEAISIFLNAAKLVSKPVLALAGFVFNRTQLQLLLPRGDGAALSEAHVADQGGYGLFYFGLTTQSKESVEITSIKVSYDSPLTLKDPDSLGFFEPSVSTSKNLSFSLCWKGTVVLTRDLIVPFALEAHFPPPLKASRVSVHITARRIATLWSMETLGRIYRTDRDVTLRLLASPQQGYNIPEGIPSRPLQPFLKNAPFTLHGSSVVRIDYTDAAGMTKSKLHLPTK